MSQGFGTGEVGNPIQGCPLTGPPPNVPPTEEDPSHWIELELVDSATGKPVPHEEYRITLPTGVLVRGYLDKDGLARVTGIESPGDCKLEFPRIYKGECTRG